MDESLEKEFQEKICVLCNNKKCQKNIFYKQTGKNFKQIYCPDYKPTHKIISKQHIRESILDEKDRIKHILMM